MNSIAIRTDRVLWEQKLLERYEQVTSVNSFGRMAGDWLQITNLKLVICKNSYCKVEMAEQERER